jgi:hypothetical protein
LKAEEGGEEVHRGGIVQEGEGDRRSRRVLTWTRFMVKSDVSRWLEEVVIQDHPGDRGGADLPSPRQGTKNRRGGSWEKE